MKNYGGTASKPAFFTYEENINVKRKCENAHMLYVCLQDIQNYDDLFKQLDEYMKATNTR